MYATKSSIRLQHVPVVFLFMILVNCSLYFSFCFYVPHNRRHHFFWRQKRQRGFTYYLATIRSLLDPGDDSNHKSPFYSTSTTNPTAKGINATNKRAAVTSPTLRTAPAEITTKYTITNCPPTDSHLLQTVVTRHVEAIDRYLQHRPIATHTQLAFNEFFRHFQSIAIRNSQYTPDDNVKTGERTVKETKGESTINTLINKKNGNFPSISYTKIRLILDSGCGTGRSTIQLAKRVKEQQQGPITSKQKAVVVVGVDRSIARLRRSRHYRDRNNNISEKELHRIHENLTGSTAFSSTSRVQQVKYDDGFGDSMMSDEEDHSVLKWVDDPANNIHICWIRADLVDFWRLLYKNNITVQEHYILYPNPYPKTNRWKQRWYGQAIFPLIISLLNSEVILVRSNWSQYLAEFLQSVQIIQNMTKTTIPSKESKNNNNLRNIVIDKSRGYTATGIHQRLLPNSYSNTSNITAEKAWTNFEQKYDAIGEPTYELKFVHARWSSQADKDQKL